MRQSNDPIADYGELLVIQWAWNNAHQSRNHNKCECGYEAEDYDEMIAHWLAERNKRA